MAKLMEIINKNQNLKNGTITLKFLDTTFTQLTRKLGSLPGANFKALEANDILSKETLVSLNQEQLLFKPKLLKWKDSYNAYLEILRQKGISGLTDFEYNFSSLIDYSSKYEPGKTLVDYYLLQEVVNAEKEMYEFGHFWGRNHIKQNANVLKEWSKNKNYGSTVGMVQTNFELRKDTTVQTITGNTYGITIKTEHFGRGDFVYLQVSGLSKIPSGTSSTIKLGCKVLKKKNTASHDDGGGTTYWYYYANCYLKITRNLLGDSLNDDGYFSFKAWGNGDSYTTGSHDDGYSTICAFDKVREQPKIKTYTGNGSPYFDTDDNNFSLPWLKSRILK